MSEPLFSLYGFPVTAYGLGIFLSLALCAVFAALHLKKQGFEPRTLETFLLFAIPLGVILGRAVYVLIRLNFFLGWENALALRFWQGGYSVWGVILAFLLAGVLTGKLLHIKPARLLDALAPGALLMLALSRFMEGFAGQGFGQEVPALLRFFPFAVVNEYEEWRYAVFVLEGLAALVFMLKVLRYKGEEGNKTRLALILFCAFQIVFESLREDEVLSWGFVKASQMFSAIGLYLILLGGLYFRGNSAWRAPRHLAQATFFLLIFVIVGLEFAIDKTTIDINLIYIVMTAVCLGLCLLVRHCAINKEKRTAIWPPASENIA